MSVNEPGEDVGAELDLALAAGLATSDPGGVVTQITDHLRSRRGSAQRDVHADDLGEQAEGRRPPGLGNAETAGYARSVAGRSALFDGTARHDGDGLFNAVAVILLSRLPDQPPAPRSALDTVLGAGMWSAGSMSAEAATCYTTALIWSLLYSGRAKDAADLADREGMLALHRVAATAPPCTNSASYSVLAETYLFNGRLRDSVACARFACDYAAEVADDGCQFRAQGILSAALAMSGDIRQATEAADAALQLGVPHGWTTHHSAGPLLLADVLIRARQADAAGIEQTCATLGRLFRNDPVYCSVTRYCNAVLQGIRQEYRQLVANARLMALSADAGLCPPYLRDLAAAMESIGHVHLGDPGAALTLLDGRTSPPEHSVCFELLRATAYLQLGESRRAIDATEGCARGHREHSIVTLVSVLLRRALAYEALGLPDAADAEYSNANHLAHESGLLSATLGLPVAALQVLFDRMAINEPVFAAQVSAALPQSYECPNRPDLSFEPPRLTQREAVLAGWLVTDLSLREIAAELHVSINTVKSQVGSLYRKLDVSSRDDATYQLRRTGLYQPSQPTRTEQR